MDIEKIKKSTKWDPSKGDYINRASYERKLHMRKRKRVVFLKILSILILIAAVIILYLNFS